MKWRWLAVVLAIAVLLGTAGGALAMASPGFEIPWQAASTGGGGAASSTNYTVSLTVGQTAISASAGAGTTVSLGYWQAAETTRLPLITN